MEKIALRAKNKSQTHHIHILVNLQRNQMKFMKFLFSCAFIFPFFLSVCACVCVCGFANEFTLPYFISLLVCPPGLL